jgi:hypothetical protein
VRGRPQPTDQVSTITVLVDSPLMCMPYVLLH